MAMTRRFSSTTTAPTFVLGSFDHIATCRASRMNRSSHFLVIWSSLRAIVSSPYLVHRFPLCLLGLEPRPGPLAVRLGLVPAEHRPVLLRVHAREARSPRFDPRKHSPL